MTEKPTVKVSVVLQREEVQSRWETHRWTLHGVLPDVGGEPRTIVEQGPILQRLYPGFDAILFRDEAEGYYLNVTSDEPSVFVAVRTDDSGDAYPFQVTLSYNEAARWMDGSERVERVPGWPELTAWIAAWVAENYKPEPKQRRRPRSFAGKEGILRPEGDQ